MEITRLILMLSFIPKCVKTHLDFMKHWNFWSYFSLLRKSSYAVWLETRSLLTSQALEMERSHELKYILKNLTANHVYVTNIINIITQYKTPSSSRVFSHVDKDTSQAPRSVLTKLWANTLPSSRSKPQCRRRANFPNHAVQAMKKPL